MGFFSLSKNQAEPRVYSPGYAPNIRRDDSSRVGGILLKLLWVVAIVVLLGALRWVATANQRPPTPPQPPLDFELIVKRYRQEAVWLRSHEEVEALLGPPTDRGGDDPELRQAEAAAEGLLRDIVIPAERFWDRWVDPEDPNRWVAVLYAGGLGEYKAYWSVKKGF